MIGISVALGVGSLIGLYYMLIYINVVLQLELFGLADAEFPPDKIDIYYKYRTVYLVCGIIILLLFISLIVFNILMMTSKNNKNLDTNYQLVHRLADFNNFYLPLIISGIFIILLLVVMQSFTKDKLKKLELVN